jgi:hypothetical protein
MIESESSFVFFFFKKKKNLEGELLGDASRLTDF